MIDDPYVYPGTTVLQNKLDIRDQARLDLVERRLTTERASQGVPSGRFDLKHLQAIHKHLFQDLYSWAGEIRTREMSKGESRFQHVRFIETGMADIHRRFQAGRGLRNKTPEQFAKAAAEILGDINFVHPFREGNGRTQLLFLQQMAEHAGHTLSLAKIDPVQWIEASKQSIDAQHKTMASCIESALEPSLDLGRGRER